MIGRLIALVVCVIAAAGLWFIYEDWVREGGDEVVVYEPGTYQGAADTPLDAQQEEELRGRVRNQNPI